MLVLREWRRLIGWPCVLFALAFGVLGLVHLDLPIARALYYDPQSGWIGAGSGDWWAHRIIHGMGRWVPRFVAAATLAAWLASFKLPRLGAWRRELGYAFVGMALVVLLVGVLKELTNVDCPWSLAGFGGDRPYVALFGDRPDTLPRAACFPGAHASSGFALFAFYFALRDRARRAARWAFWGGLTCGLIFAIGQEARGAHFLSHDLASAALAWLLLAGLYARMLAPSPRSPDGTHR